TVRKPTRDEAPPEEAAICVIPRDSVPRKGLAGAVAEATFPLPRTLFTREPWVLEPKPVMDLLDKIRRNGVPLAEYAGRAPINGIKTGLNEAFVVDNATADNLLREDPNSANVIQPFRRGQDLQRWLNDPPSLQLIALASRGENMWPWSSKSEGDGEIIFKDSFPAIYRHLKRFESGLRGRESRGKFWWEPQTAANPAAYGRTGIIYQEIQFYPCYAFNQSSELSNNKTFIITSDCHFLLSILNSPLMWWHNWRFLPHMKDEALSPMSFRMEALPIAPGDDAYRQAAQIDVDEVIAATRVVSAANRTIHDWLHHEFGLDKPGAALAQPHRLDADGFAAAVRKALPKARRLTAADIQRLKDEHRETVEPARRAADEALVLERRLSDLVNAAYGLTPEEVELMWRTAPPRMPFRP
ncbi:MAG: hypothetical protein Q8S58_12735, partial [Bosea sp. (in: a-proteobacteria)]|nr:hypothetical protein [Bosea sp. (in: a-proteobacteria)]